MLEWIEPTEPDDRDEPGPPGPPAVLILASIVGLAWAVVWLAAASAIVLEFFGVEPLTTRGAEAVQRLGALAGASPPLIVLVQGPLAAILFVAAVSAMAGRPGARAWFGFWAWLTLGVGAMSLLFAMSLTALGWACMAYALATLGMLMLPPVVAYFARPVPVECGAERDEYEIGGARDPTWIDDPYDGH